MDHSISVAGKQYISAIRAAKKVGYASDYVGQLCRSGKIPARLVGKAWYVDLDSLIDHKRNRKLGKRGRIVSNAIFDANTRSEKTEKNKETITQTFSNSLPDLLKKRNPAEIAQEKFTKDFVITYESDDRPRLPELRKNFSISAKSFRPHYIEFKKELVAAGLILAVALTGWTGFELYRIPTIREGVRSISLEKEQAFVKAAIAWIENLFEKEETSGIADISNNSEEEGIVVIPETESSVESIARIKRAFSDDVEIRFDEDKTTGVIRPIFHDGDDTENYAFLLVPIGEKNKPTTSNE